MNDEAVYRTDPATPGLLNTYWPTLCHSGTLLLPIFGVFCCFCKENIHINVCKLGVLLSVRIGIKKYLMCEKKQGH